jgi:hypothetical protein
MNWQYVVFAMKQPQSHSELSRNMPVGTEENHEKLWSRAAGVPAEIRNAQFPIRVKSITVRPTSSVFHIRPRKLHMPYISARRHTNRQTDRQTDTHIYTHTHTHTHTTSQI